jgi:hypothetical protein
MDDLIKDFNLQEFCIIQSFDHESLRIYEQVHMENRWSNRKISESTGSTASA